MVVKASMIYRERSIEIRIDNNVQRVRALVHQDRRLTIRMLDEELNLNRKTVRQILTEDLFMKKLCAKMVPKNLSAEQKHERIATAQDCLKQIPKFINFFKFLYFLRIPSNFFTIFLEFLQKFLGITPQILQNISKITM